LTQKLKRNNPFFEEEFNTFIGVANIYLKALFYDLKIDHIVPIINTQGEVITVYSFLINRLPLKFCI
jgi:hypothetical protein